ncbi:MAG: Nif3-like dinuclear metal center hexameric protein, partial [Planctomycetota bacterium]
VGLLVGDRSQSVARLMTCLTLTPDSVAEAVDRQADLVVTHHPLPFKPVRRLTTDAVEGQMLWDLARAGVSVYSPHTAFDSAAGGINAQLATGLELKEVAPFAADEEDPSIGTGRAGRVDGSLTVDGLAERTKRLLGLDAVWVVGAAEQPVTQVGLACGAGGSMLDDAIAAGCDAMVTGEATFHGCLAAEARRVALVLVGHYASERFAVEALAQQLADAITGVDTWACAAEHDPLRTV